MLGIVFATGIVAGLLGAGWIWQIWAQRNDRRRYPPPGRLVDVGGRRLHLVCAGGEDGPSVVLEAGAGDDSTVWREVTQRAAAFARVYAYDRAGQGWSDAAPKGRTFEERADDLAALLERVGAPPPYVLVGHSYGGYIVRLFARARPASVAGIVLVDASEEAFAFSEAGRSGARSFASHMSLLAWAARFGLLRARMMLSRCRLVHRRENPEDRQCELDALSCRTERYAAAADEMSAYDLVPPAMTKPGGFGSLGVLPLVVISRSHDDPERGTRPDPDWRRAQQRLVGLSSQGRHIVAPHSGHMIPLTEPELIADAIRDLLPRPAPSTR
jgi:pimeloyl-ACP methyl ester carboxylesterase